MTSLHVIENKIASIQKYLAILDAYKGRTVTEIENDPTLRGAIERYLYLAAQASIDLAEAAIAYREYRKPTTYRESFEILVENGAISGSLGERLIRMAAFRNKLAHAYENFDYSVVVDILKQSLTDLAEFTTEITQKF
jgi:uncharacterized protein YutE (UPF0331/DUF86 family)